MSDWVIVLLVVACMAAMSIAFIVVGTQANCPTPTQEQLSR